MTSLVGSALGAGGNTNPDGCVGGGVGGPLCSLIDVNELLRLCNGLDFKMGCYRHWILFEQSDVFGGCRGNTGV